MGDLSFRAVRKVCDDAISLLDAKAQETRSGTGDSIS
jgi:hypothetical protein